MKLSEEKYLKKAIRDIKRYAKQYSDAGSFYRHLDALNCPSLQEVSFQSDLKFFEECQFIFHVILSIIAHPHLTNQGEDVVLRAEQVHHLSSEMFLKTLKEPSFWKNKNHHLSPQYVYYYQNIDDLKIYENYLVVRLVDLLENELNQYRYFYVSIIKTIDGNKSLSLNEDQIQIAFDSIQQLMNKIQKIKSTYFYKEVSKANFSLTTIHLTNIFLKNQSYRYCFRFYKKIIGYGDKKSLTQDFMAYYYCILLKNLKARNMQLSAKSKKTPIILNKFGWIDVNQNLYFYSKDFKIEIEKEKNTDGFCIHILNRKVADRQANLARHLLFFTTNSNLNDFQLLLSDLDTKKYQTIEALSLWNIFYLDQEQYRFTSSKNEQELMSLYLDEKMLCTPASYSIYSKYCPVCKESNVFYDDHVYQCLHCQSQYVFYDQNQMIWYQKVRRI